MDASQVKREEVASFFQQCEYLGYLVTRPLSHIRRNWELIWDHENDEYLVEDDSYSDSLNTLIEELATVNPPPKYHDHEDRLAEHVNSDLGWNVKEINGRWVGEDYEPILEQGNLNDIQQKNLVLAAAGRIRAAIIRGQTHFDKMEQSHQRILAGVLAIILYHRTDYE
jgi:hypothetical protein